MSILFLLALFCAESTAQEISPMLLVNQEHAGPGLKIIQSAQNSPGGRMASIAFEAQLSTEQVRIALESPRLRGKAMPLGAYVDRDENAAGFALAIRNREGHRALEGLYFNGMLLSWPARAALLIVSSDGTPALQEAESLRTGDDRAVISCDDGTSFTLATLNGGPMDGGIVLYSDHFAASRQIPPSWPDGTMALPLAQPRRGNRALWDHDLPREERLWKPEKWQPIESAESYGSDYLLVVPSADEAAMDALTASRLLIEIPLPPQVRYSLLAAEAGELFMRDGIKVGTEMSQAIGDECYVAADPATRRIWMVQNGGASSSTKPFSPGEILDGLMREGARDAAMISGGERLLVKQVQRDLHLAARGPLTQVALVTGRGTMRLRGERADLQRLQLAWATGSNADQTQHRPEAAIDNRLNDEVRLDAFWSDTSTRVMGKEQMPWLEIGLAQRARVEAIDLIHAEATGFSPQFNLAGFRLLGRERNQAAWKELAVVLHNSPQAMDRVKITHTQPLIALRMEVLKPNFMTGNNRARLPEIIVWGETVTAAE